MIWGSKKESRLHELENDVGRLRADLETTMNRLDDLSSELMRAEQHRQQSDDQFQRISEEVAEIADAKENIEMHRQAINKILVDVVRIERQATIDLGEFRDTTTAMAKTLMIRTAAE